MDSIILIDLSSIYWRCWHASESEDVSTAKRNTLNIVESLSREHNHSAVCIDVPPYKRSEIFEEYKAGRSHPEMAVEELRAAITELKSFGINWYGEKGYEADDIIGTLAMQAKENGLDVFISSADKDLLQIEFATVCEPFNKKILSSEDVFGCSRDKVLDVLALSGDKADNVPGISGVGPKKALQILEFIGSVESFLNLSNVDQEKIVAGLPEKLQEQLLSSIIPLELSFGLVKLDYSAPVKLVLSGYDSNVETDPPEKPVEPEKDNLETFTPVVVKRDSKAVIEADKRNASWSLSLEPSDLKEAWKLTGILYESRMFGQFPNHQAIMAIILRGRALGIDATTALSSFHVIEGKPTMHASLMIGLIYQRGKCEYFEPVESTDKKAVWATKRVGGRNNVKMEFTIEEANAAGYLKPTRSGKPSNWHKIPKTMLRWRAATELARAVYPDVVTGLYTPDEIEDANL